jgi:hypothetical protein
MTTRRGYARHRITTIHGHPSLRDAFQRTEGGAVQERRLL